MNKMEVTIRCNTNESVVFNFKVNSIIIGEICIFDVADFNYDTFIIALKTNARMEMHYGEVWIKTNNGKTIFGIEKNEHLYMFIECLNDECMEAVKIMAEFGWKLYEKKLKVVKIK